MTIKSLAVLSGREDVMLSKPFLGLSDKLLGQIRTGLAFLGGVLISAGVIDATQADITETTNLAFELLKQVENIIGGVSLLVSSVSSWFSRDKR